MKGSFMKGSFMKGFLTLAVTSFPIYRIENVKHFFGWFSIGIGVEAGPFQVHFLRRGGIVS